MDLRKSGDAYNYRNASNRSKSEAKLLRIYSLQYLTHNSPNRRVRQPLCDPRRLQNIGQTGEQQLGGSSGKDGPGRWGISRGVTDQHSTHSHQSTGGIIAVNTSCLQPWIIFKLQKTMELTYLLSKMPKFPKASVFQILILKLPLKVVNISLLVNHEKGPEKRHNTLP